MDALVVLIICICSMCVEQSHWKMEYKYVCCNPSKMYIVEYIYFLTNVCASYLIIIQYMNESHAV